MQHLSFRGSNIRNPWRAKLTKSMLVILFLSVVVSILAACGSATAATGQIPKASVTPTATFAPTPTAVPTRAPRAPTPKPTVAPTPKPSVAPPPQPTQPPPPPAPAVLDLRPSSMSFVGHLDCSVNNGEYVCLARVISEANAQSNLNWFAYTNIPGGVTFSPARGTLAPGQSVLVSIFVPVHACTHGLFFFQGPINTHTITWAC